MLRIIFSLCLLSCLLNSISSLAKPSRVAIIIDDIGYRKSDVQALYLPGSISYAILPHTPYGLSLALQAKAKSNDVILHIPMEAQNGKRLGPGALTSKMDETSIRQQLSQAFAEVPFALGINNHMGSKLTELYNPMAWTMQFLKERELIFIDSMTSSASQAEKVAKSFGVPSLHRHIFLDNQLEHSYISAQFNKLILATKNNQTVVAIAHPHPESIRSLRKLLPLLAENNIELVPISALVENNHKLSNSPTSADE